MQAEHKTIPKWRKIIKEASSSRTWGHDHIIRPDPTRQFNDHNASGAVVTEPASQVELSWVGSGNAITLIAQLNWTEKLPVFSREWSELHNWQKTGNFSGRVELSEWAHRPVWYDSTQLARWVTTVPSANWVELGRKMWSRLTMMTISSVRPGHKL